MLNRRLSQPLERLGRVAVVSIAHIKFRLNKRERRYLWPLTPEVKRGDRVSLEEYYEMRRNDPRLVDAVRSGIQSNLIVVYTRPYLSYSTIDPDNVGYEIKPCLKGEICRPMPDTVLRHEFNKIQKLKNANAIIKLHILAWLHCKLPKYTRLESNRPI